MPSRKTLANAIRFLSMDAVQAAQSGHPGMPMGMADIAEVLWNDFLRHNPQNPNWLNRDRFVVSNGHGSMLLYSLLHLSGYDLALSELQNFRQLHSKTPGHPEVGEAPGVETTTGPLGQGIANAVGMALAEQVLAREFNTDSIQLFDHHTYVFMGDGCMMEGVSHEACSLAGTLKLGKLIAFWDDNGISIDGQVQPWFGDDTVKRFEAYGWQVLANVDGHDPEKIKAAITAAKQESQKPSLICCRTVIGYGSPNLAGTAKTHGAPLGAAEIAATRTKLAWPYAAFEIPQEIYAAWDAKEKGTYHENSWQQLLDKYTQQFPEKAAEIQRRFAKQLPADFNSFTSEFINAQQEQQPNVATRKASLLALNAFAPHMPEMLGGSADLTESNLTLWEGASIIKPGDFNGKYLHYGVREFGMSAMMNGMALHGGLIPFGGTFLTFVDYAKNAVRMAALMQQRVIFVYTHDSIGLGEDGPTHQPVEHLGMLRLTPNVSVWRPCDAVETAVAWQQALLLQTAPSCLALSRQNLPTQIRTTAQVELIKRGGYILLEPQTAAQAIIIATGSEVVLAMQAATTLNAHGIAVRVVSMPSTSVFDAQAKDYRDSVLPAHINARVAIEAAAADYWWKYVGLAGAIVGMQRFGLSAPAAQAFEYLNFTVEHVVGTVEKLLK